MDKKRIKLPIIVEGRYDKAVLSSVFDCRVFTTDGFGIFKSNEKKALIKRIAEGGIIVLTDSDGGGRQIRSYLQSILPRDKVHNLYIPTIPGKEKRKTKPSKSGTLGVEGMEREVLERVLAPFTEDGGRVEKNEGEMLTMVDIYALGLTGSRESQARRDRIGGVLGLPPGMGAKPFLSALNIITDREELRKICDEELGTFG